MKALQLRASRTYYFVTAFLSASDTLLSPELHDSAVEAEQVQSGKSHQCIDDSGDPGHVAEEQTDEVQSENSDQSPVDCTDDDECQSCIIKSLTHCIFSFLPVFCRKSVYPSDVVMYGLCYCPRAFRSALV